MGRKKQKKQKQKLRSGAGKGGFRGMIMVPHSNPRWRKNGPLSKPRPGADMTCRQVVAAINFKTNTGVTGGSSRVFPVNTGGFGFVFNHALADLPQASSWEALFDQYKFEEIELHMYPLTSEATTTNTATNFCDATQIVLDFDDGNALANENAALEYENCQTVMHYDHIVARYKPAVSPAYYSAGAFTGYGVTPSDRNWLDVASPNIINYGIKGWVGALAAASTMLCGWVVYAQYTVSFRNVR